MILSALLILPLSRPAVAAYESYMATHTQEYHPPEVARKSVEDSKRPSLSLGVHPNQFRLAKRIGWVEKFYFFFKKNIETPQ